MLFFLKKVESLQNSQIQNVKKKHCANGLTTVGHHSPKISPLPNPSHSGLGDWIWIFLFSLCRTLARQEQLIRPRKWCLQVTERWFMARKTLWWPLLQQEQTLAVSAWPLVCSISLRKSPVFLYKTIDFLYKSLDFPYKMQSFLKSDGFLSKNKRQDGCYLH